MGEGSFARKQIASVIISDSVVTIERNAFHNCSVLANFDISVNSNLTTIGNYAFDDCENVTRITVSEENNTFSSDSVLVYSKDFSKLEKVPEGINGDLILKEGLISLRYSTFYQKGNNLNSITIPHSIQSIGNAAFRRLNLEYLAYNGTIAEWTTLLESGNINSNYLGYNESERTISSIRCTDWDAPLFLE